jgi:hypothetical protein
MALWRRFGGLKEYLAVDQFWALSKPLLALSLFWFYFSWSEFLTFWYGRTPTEHNLLLLGEMERTMIVLRDIQGYSYEEIAALLHTRVGTVKSRLNRARLHLRALLDGKL